MQNALLMHKAPGAGGGDPTPDFVLGNHTISDSGGPSANSEFGIAGPVSSPGDDPGVVYGDTYDPSFAHEIFDGEGMMAGALADYEVRVTQQSGDALATTVGPAVDGGWGSLENGLHLISGAGVDGTVLVEVRRASDSELLASGTIRLVVS